MTPPLVFVPGSMCDDRIFAHQLDELDGAVATPVPDQDSIEAMAQAVLDAAPPRFIPVGLSLGGIIAAEIAAAAPERVVAAVLADTNLAPPDDKQLALRRGWKDALAQDGDTMLTTIVAAGVENLTADPDTHRDVIVAMAADIGPKTFARQNEALLHRRDRRDDLAAVATLLIVGALDRTCPVEIHAELQTRIDDAQLVVIPDAGHLSSLDQPHQFTTAIDDWLSRR